MAQEDVFKKLVSHCKEYGFVFPSSDIYDGLGAVYDYGQMGVELKNNIKKYWWDSMVLLHENIVGIDSAIFMHPTIWKASGHVDAFNDPLIDNKDSKKRYRADVLIEDQLAKYDDKINKEVAKAAKRFGESFDEAQFRSTNGRVLEHQEKRDALHTRFAKALNDGDLEELRQIIIDEEIVCPISGTKNWTEVRQFNLMFSTEMGSTSEGAMKIYLRPETAQGIFVNFKTFLISGHSNQTVDFPDLPFIEGIDFCCHMGNPVQIFVSLVVFQPLAQLGRHLEIIISALNIFHCRPVFPDHIREKFAFIDFPDLQPQL